MTIFCTRSPLQTLQTLRLKLKRTVTFTSSTEENGGHQVNMCTELCIYWMALSTPSVLGTQITVYDLSLPKRYKSNFDVLSGGLRRY